MQLYEHDYLEVEADTTIFSDSVMTPVLKLPIPLLLPLGEFDMDNPLDGTVLVLSVSVLLFLLVLRLLLPSGRRRGPGRADSS